MDPVLKIVFYLFKKSKFENDDVTYESFFSNGVAFPKFVAISFNIDKIPGITQNPKNQFQKNINNNTALQYACTNNKIISKISPDINSEKDRSYILSLILKNQCFHINIEEIIDKCNKIVKPLGIKYNNKSDIINCSCIISLLNILTDGKIDADTKINDFNETMIKIFNLADIPLVIDETSLSSQNQFTYFIQLLIIFDLFSDKINILNNVDQEAKLKAIDPKKTEEPTKSNESFNHNNTVIYSATKIPIIPMKIKEMPEKHEINEKIQASKSINSDFIAKDNEQIKSVSPSIEVEDRKLIKSSTLINQIEQSKEMDAKDKIPQKSISEYPKLVKISEINESDQSTNSNKSDEQLKHVSSAIDVEESDSIKSSMLVNQIEQAKEMNTKDKIPQESMSKYPKLVKISEISETDQSTDSNKSENTVNKSNISEESKTSVDENSNTKNKHNRRHHKSSKHHHSKNDDKNTKKIIEVDQQDEINAKHHHKSSFKHHQKTKCIETEKKEEHNDNKKEQINVEDTDNISFSYETDDEDDENDEIKEYDKEEEEEEFIDFSDIPKVDLKDYKIIKDIGQGSFGIVKLIKNIATDRLYAAKIAKSNFDSNFSKNQFYMEIKSQITAKNPAVLDLIGVSFKDFDNNDYPTIITDFLSNRSLQDHLNDEYKSMASYDFSNKKKYIILLGIALGMKNLHFNGIVHRDLKPENILLDNNFYPYICDFGLSVVSTYFSNISTDELNTNCGTLMYMAPEIIRKEPYTYKVDVYSFALIAYELITGQPPYKNINYFTLLKVISKGERPDLSDIKDESICNFLKKCWNENPSLRPTFNEIVNELMQEKYIKFFDADLVEIEEYLDLFDNSLKLFNSKSDIASSIKKLADSGDARAMFNYGYILLQGDGIQLNIKEGIKYIKLAAHKRFVMAMNLLGEFLNSGQNIPKNQNAATHYFKLSAKKKDPQGILMYGIALKDGIGISPNITKGIKYIKLASNKGLTKATYTYAKILFNGEGVPKNLKDAADYCKIAAEKADNEACCLYCQMYENGYGVPIDLKKAEEYYNLADEYGNKDALYLLGNMLINKFDCFESYFVTKGIVALIKAAGKGNIEANYQMGIRYLFGNGIELNKNTASEYLKKAADLGHSEAMHYYANMLFNGDGIPKDDENAFYYYKKSIDCGNTKAMLTYGNIIFYYLPPQKKEGLKYVKMAFDKGEKLASEYYHKMLNEFENLEKNANNGDPQSLFEYAIMLYSDNSDQKNVEEAQKYFKMAADKGIVAAMYNYALILYENEGNRDEYLKYFKMAVDKEHPRALFFYGQILMNDNTSPDNINAAAFYLKKAIDLGIIEAMYLYACLIIDHNIYGLLNDAIKYLCIAYQNGMTCAEEKMILARNKFAISNLKDFAISGNMKEFSILLSLLRENNTEFDKREIVEILLLAIEKENDDAMLFYADMLFYGDGVPINKKEAIRYYEMSANYGNQKALLFLSNLLYNGEEMPCNKKLAARYYKKLADNGDEEAMFLYAEMLFKGDEIPINKEEAINYYKQSLAKGNSNAILAFGKILYEGKDLPEDKKSAAKLFEFSSKKGNAEAMFLYAEMLYKGIEIPINKEEAMNYYKKSADKGYSDAMLEYANLKYEDRDIDEAYKYYKLCIDNGNSDVILLLADLISSQKDPYQNIGLNHPYLKLAADKGHIKSMYLYGRLLTFDNIIPQNLEEAFKYIKMSADKGYEIAILECAKMLHDGIGVDIDKKQAAHYYEIAASTESSNGIYEYAEILYNGDGVIEDKVKAAELYKKASDNGNTMAMKKYGEMLYYGDGIKMDRTEGEKYLNMSIEREKWTKQLNLNLKAMINMLNQACFDENDDQS